MAVKSISDMLPSIMWPTVASPMRQPRAAPPLKWTGEEQSTVIQVETEERRTAVELKRIMRIVLVVGALAAAISQTRAQGTQTPYPKMAPVDQYLITEENAEIALARSAAPESISSKAEVMILAREGYKTAVQGTNGFLCLVERSWAQSEDDAEFWNPKMRAPHCFNAQAARSFAPIYLMKTRLVLAGKSKTEIAQAIASALDKKDLPALEPGAMAYMMSKQQYLNDRGKSWHPHVMFYSPGDMTKSWAADAPNSPVMVASDPEERVTILFLLADKWSDGTPDLSARK